MAEDKVQTILQQYPQYAYMLNDPELRYLLIANLDPSGAFDSASFTAELLNTNWWKNNASSARNWAQQVGVDPATAEQHMQQKMVDVSALARSAGLQLSDAQIRWETSLALQQGWTDIQLRQNLLQTAVSAGQTRESTLSSGTIGGIGQQVKNLSAQYLLPITDQAAAWYAQDIWQGKMQLDDLKAQFGNAAKFTWAGKNPELAAAVDQGQTPRQFLDPQVQAVASQLEMSPDQIDLLNPKYSAMLNYTDKSGALRMMTVPEAQVWARQQDEFKNTNGGRQAASDLTLQLAQTFGARQ